MLKSYVRPFVLWFLVSGPIALGVDPACDPKVPTLPRLLTKSFYDQGALCKDAANQGKDYIIVGLKSHRCDCCTTKSCLEETRNISDPANRFIQENFAVYHTRLSRNLCQTETCVAKEGEPGAKRLEIRNQIDFPGAENLYEYWSQIGQVGYVKMRRLDRPPKAPPLGSFEGPGMTVLQVKNCEVLGFIPMSDIVTSERSPAKASDGEKAAFAAKDRARRATETNAQLLEIIKLPPFTPTLETDRLIHFKMPYSEEVAKQCREFDFDAYLAAMDDQMKKSEAAASLDAAKNGVGRRPFPNAKSGPHDHSAPTKKRP